MDLHFNNGVNKIYTPCQKTTPCKFSYCTVIVEEGKIDKEFMRESINTFDTIKTYKEVVKKFNNLLFLLWSNNEA